MTKNNSGAVMINHKTIKHEHMIATFGRWNCRNNGIFLSCVFLDVRASSPDVWQDSLYTQQPNVSRLSCVSSNTHANKSLCRINRLFLHR